MRSTKTAICLAVLAASLALPTGAGAVPREFFGIAPQTELTRTDVEYMRAGRIGSVRWPLIWESIQPTRHGGYDWSSFDHVVETAAAGGIRVLPFFYGTPKWLTGKYTTMPIDSARKRSAWVAFVKAAVQRYGPGGAFWAERAPGVVSYEPTIPSPLPVRAWQVWNEANFFYFAYPVSPTRYARLLKLTQPAIKSVDRGAKVILSGLFGEPDERAPRGMSAISFLDRLYRVPGIKARFDAVALHPYAADASDLIEMTEEARALVRDKHDLRTQLYITEMGWGSEDNYQQVAFEQGKGGQARQLRRSYSYLIKNRHRLNLKATYWFSWKDLPDVCNFCDSVGFFHQGPRLRPKPAWHAFVGLTGGRPRP
jgi:Beta-galactosidase